MFSHTRKSSLNLTTSYKMAKTTNPLSTAKEFIDESAKIIEAALFIKGDIKTSREIQVNLDKAFSIMEDQEMDFVRFGEIKRFTDPNYQPYTSIKTANDIIQRLPIPQNFDSANEVAWNDIKVRLMNASAALAMVIA